ncbi:MAG: hypothetical protein AAGF23_13105 [Acidobacteriota bacterium]
MEQAFLQLLADQSFDFVRGWLGEAIGRGDSYGNLLGGQLTGRELQHERRGVVQVVNSVALGMEDDEAIASFVDLEIF